MENENNLSMEADTLTPQGAESGRGDFFNQNPYKITLILVLLKLQRFKY